MMTYKGCRAGMAFGATISRLAAQEARTNDIPTFEGAPRQEPQQAFRDTVDDQRGAEGPCG